MLLLLILLFIPLDGQIPLYYSSDQSNKFQYDHDCFYYHQNYLRVFYKDVSLYEVNEQIIPFCRRDDIDDGLIIPDSKISTLTFEQLKERNVTSLNLYTWLAPIDLIEHYQAFREGQLNTSSYKFYNCSSVNRFGSFCQYYIHHTASLQSSFNDIVTNQLKAQQKISTDDTCYIQFNCTRNNYSWCLYWQEICDRKVDCWPEPIDEEHCFQLENNECSENEYRCRNGQCIPQEYYMDNPTDPDCLDGTDENMFIISANYPTGCNGGDPSIRCSDRQYELELLSLSRAGPYRFFQDTEFYRYLFARKNNPHLSDECWSTMICMIDVFPTTFLNDSVHAHLFNGSCNNICFNETHCGQRIKQYCPSLFEFPAEPIAWHDVHLFYSWNQTDLPEKLPHYVCFNKQSCDYWNSTMVTRKITNPTTSLSCQMRWKITQTSSNALTRKILNEIRVTFERFSALSKMETENDCLETTQFQCGKRCLSRHRLFDRQRDCFDRSDELYNQSCSLNDRYRIFCEGVETLFFRKDGCVLEVFFEREYLKTFCNSPRKQIAHFPTLCDGYIEQTILINGQIETDEQHCEAWLCDNQYTRCDGIWNCLNGQDEIGCAYSYCQTEKGHPCLLWNTSQPICLPISRAGDGIVDCIGATDERHLCRDQSYAIDDQQGNMYRCWKNGSIHSQTVNDLEVHDCISPQILCNENVMVTCLLNDNKSPYLCQNHSYFGDDIDSRFCKWSGRPTVYLHCLLNDDYKLLMWGESASHAPFFYLANSSFRPYKAVPNSQPLVSRRMHVKNSMNDAAARLSVPFEFETDLQSYRCHGGILIYMFINESSSLSNTTEKRCFCPPPLYGKQCEYSNQRVTVSLQIAILEGQTPFSFVMYLVDNQTDMVQSYDTINYLSIRDCQKKFVFHLLYSTRPKASNLSYSVRIDAFETKTLKYRASWIYPITYSFLPVYRLSIRLSVPVDQPTSDESCRLQCSSSHGECTLYANTNEFFCRCKPGWFGRQCTQSYQCDCSSQSFCVGSWNNRSICICPLHKFGPRCYLTNDACEKNMIGKCHHGGECVSNDIRLEIVSSTICICSDAYSGATCQTNRSHINITFALTNEYIPAYIFLHFITVGSHPSKSPLLATKKWGPHERVSTIKKIPIDSTSVAIYWDNEFHLLFAEDQQNMYLLILQNEYQASINYKVTMRSNQRCPPIRELLNTTIVSLASFHRVKYYHISCQENVNLSCFHDEDNYLCLCTHDHRANCMEFDHRMKYNCRNVTFCENDGECFQNNLTCPSAAICSCPTCYFGTRCQLTTKVFGLSLDVILGYQIWPNHSFVNQPLALQISAWLTLIMFIFGLINVTLSLLTFRIKHTREYGCGIYLYTASMVSLFTMTTFTLKLILLVLTQLGILQSQLFLIIQCYSIDFILKICLQIGEWLYACVSMERLFTSIKATKFDKNLSRKMSKCMIIMICIFVCGTSIHEAYYRRLLNDLEENRTWCIVRYPKSLSNMLTLYTTIMTVIHFLGPFLINIISSIGNIFISTSYRTKVDKKRTYLTHFRHQFQLLKYSIIGPIVLILLATPRIILAFTLQCMKSSRELVGLYLLAYFVSFIPPILTFVIFVLPSRDYKKAFQMSTKGCCSKR